MGFQNDGGRLQFLLVLFAIPVLMISLLVAVLIMFVPRIRFKSAKTRVLDRIMLRRQSATKSDETKSAEKPQVQSDRNAPAKKEMPKNDLEQAKKEIIEKPKEESKDEMKMKETELLKVEKTKENPEKPVETAKEAPKK